MKSRLFEELGLIGQALAGTIPKNSTPKIGGIAGFGYVTVGGMFTVLKVRDQLASYKDPGWYEHPEGTVADVAKADELKRDDIRL